MLHKKRIALNEKDRIEPTLPLIICIDSTQEFEPALILLKNHNHPLKGIELSLNLARQLDLSAKGITYLSIHIDFEPEEKELTKYLQKNRFIEIFLPQKLLHCLPYCKDARRIVFETGELSKVNSFFSEMITMSRYPLVKNMPFCHSAMEHCYEFYEQNCIRGQTLKPKECNGCLFITKCPGPGKLSPKPIIDAKKYRQAMEFVNDENTIARF